MPKPKKTIIIIGDSFVQGAGDEDGGGWTEIFKKEFEEDYNVIIRGYGGNNINDVLARVDNDLIFFNPDIIILEVGINDSRLRKSLNFSNEIEEKQFENGLYHFITTIRNKLDKQLKFIFIGTTPVVDNLTTPYKEDKYYSTEQSKKYNGIIERFCEKHHILFFDIYMEFDILPDLNNFCLGYRTK